MRLIRRVEFVWLGRLGRPVTLRLGFLENITHATALVGIKQGFFTKDLGHNVTLKLEPFSTGTEEATALLAGQLDAAYVGPNPAIKAWQTSGGKLIKVISGAASGGAQLVVKPSITTAPQLKGQKLATPSLGNTQDVALRYWLKQHGLTTTTTGGGDVLDHADHAELGGGAGVQVRPDRRRLGARAVRRRDGGGRRARAGQRGQPVAERPVRHHQPGGDPDVPRRATRPWSAGCCKGQIQANNFINSQHQVGGRGGRQRRAEPR